MLKPLGIEKGKPFQPDSRQTAILEEAARARRCDGTQRDVREHPAHQPCQAVPRHSLGLGDPREAQPGNRELQPTRRTAAIHLRRHLPVPRHRRHESRVPARTTCRHSGTRTATTSTAAGPTACTCPPNPPASAFWSLTLYDTATRSMVQNPTNDAARSGYDELKTNADGSMDLYFGPQPPTRTGEQLDRDGSRQGLLPDVPLLQPHCALFDGTWTLPDVERI